MFLAGHFQSLTQHIFQTPPLLTLDIGCGSGYWAIEAAKQWKVSMPINSSRFQMAHLPHLLYL